jgi:hypothetical protein
MKKQGEIPQDKRTIDGATLGGIATGTMHPNIIGYYNVAAQIKSQFQSDGLLGKLPAGRGH